MFQQMMMNLSKMQSTFATVVLLMMYGVFSLADPLTDVLEHQEAEMKRLLGSMRNMSSTVEKGFDKERDEYCNTFGPHFFDKSDLWSSVVAKCIHPFVFIQQDPISPAFLYELRKQIQKNVAAMYEKCSGLVKNPCDQNDWINVKKCVSDQSVRIDEAHAMEMLFGDDFTPFTTLTEKLLFLNWLSIPGFSTCTAQTVMARKP